ncbi:MAG: helix-turn-helix transcriptional regulator [Nanohaloarchaea archaeon]|nr:helix-turn-helix transcriptional regulator [Candidatus Nanohaloarchaea archaeon]
MSKNQGRIPVWCKTEEWCALKSTSKILGHKWVPAIIYHLHDNEGLRFSQIQEEVGGITNKTLSDNLDRMQDQGIVNREVENEKPVKITYELTEFGEKLVPLIEEMISWGQDNLREGEKEEAWVK